MTEEASLEFRFRKIHETRNYLIEEIKHNDLTSEKYEKTCKYLNYVENLRILVSTFTNCVSISKFASLVCHSYRYYKLCSSNKSLCNHCSNQKV